MLPLGLLSQGGGAGGAAAFELISTQLISSDTASVTFSSIPSTYKHLQMRFTARTTDAMDLGGVGVRFNSDSGSNYSYHYLDGNGSSVTSGSGASQANGIATIVTGATSTSNAFGAGIMDLLDYASTSKNKTIRTLGGKTTTGSYVRLASSAWYSTSAISSITLFDTVGGSYVSGSRFSLYGIRG